MSDVQNDRKQRANVLVIHLPTFTSGTRHENAFDTRRQVIQVRTNPFGVRLFGGEEMRQGRAPQPRNTMRKLQCQKLASSTCILHMVVCAIRFGHDNRYLRSFHVLPLSLSLGKELRRAENCSAVRLDSSINKCVSSLHLAMFEIVSSLRAIRGSAKR